MRRIMFNLKIFLDLIIVFSIAGKCCIHGRVMFKYVRCKSMKGGGGGGGGCLLGINEGFV